EFDPAGALADHLAHRGEDQRRGDADRGHPERGGEQDFEGFDHERAPSAMLRMVPLPRERGRIEVRFAEALVPPPRSGGGGPPKVVEGAIAQTVLFIPTST